MSTRVHEKVITPIDILNNEFLTPEDKEILVNFVKSNEISLEDVKELIKFEGFFRFRIISKEDLEKEYYKRHIPFTMRYVIIKKQQEGGFQWEAN